MNIKFVLLDIDDTVLDFKTAEKKAFVKTHEENDVSFCEDDYNLYHKINSALWKDMEKGLITPQGIIEIRFNLYFKERGLCQELAKKMRYSYEENLSKNADIFDDDVIETLEFMKSRAKLYSVTNGTYKVQTSRISLSGVDKYLDGQFISEKIGHRKPSKEFFDFVENNIPDFNKSQALLVGDSLTADISACKYGFCTCLIDRNNDKQITDIKPNYVIDKFYKLKDFFRK